MHARYMYSTACYFTCMHANEFHISSFLSRVMVLSFILCLESTTRESGTPTREVGGAECIFRMDLCMRGNGLRTKGTAKDY